MKKYRFKPAFSMLELVFVIVILGIVASIASELIAKVYQSYILQRAQYKASMKTELAATQIANRLASAILGTVYRIRNDGAFEEVQTALTTGGDNYIGLQWVGADTDSFSATATPGWSGFVDINVSSSPTLVTPGSTLGTTTTIINNLSSRTPAPVVYFPNDPGDYNATIASPTTLTLTGTLPSYIKEHYKLAWSSYALMVVNGDLRLYYDFAANPKVARGNTSSLLLKNVTTFKFKGAGRTLRFKICREENIGEDFNVTSCKEKAVF